VALFPLISNFKGDFVLQLLAVDSENTMDEVAAAAAHHSVGRRVAAQPGVLRVRPQGATEFLPRGQRVSEAGLQPMACLEFLYEPPVRGA
jgi:toluene monooxygenase system protein B